MANGYYIENGEAHKINKMYVGIEEKAHIIKRAYVGVNGVARQVYGINLIEMPSLSGDYTYNKNTQTVAIDNLDSENVIVTGTTSATNAGIYQVTFTLKEGKKAWKDGTSEPLVRSWTIEKKVVANVKVKGTYTFDANPKTLQLEGYDSSLMWISKNTDWNTPIWPITEMMPGAYTYITTLKDPDNYKWASAYMDYAYTSFDWVIDKAPVTYYKVTPDYIRITESNVEYKFYIDTDAPLFEKTDIYNNEECIQVRTKSKTPSDSSQGFSVALHLEGTRPYFSFETSLIYSTKTSYLIDFVLNLSIYRKNGTSVFHRYVYFERNS